MRETKPTLTTELLNHIGDVPVGKASPFPIKTYRELMEQVAKLAYLNKDCLLFFRGQNQDFHNKAGVSTFYPTIYREDNLSQAELKLKFEILNIASRQLKDLFIKDKIDGANDVSRKQYIQWSILQHYLVCATPFLDLTHSLRVACSFAQLNNQNSNGYIYIFGLPYITNRISINSEHDIVNVRLLSICPPDALRPYFQEAYLAGTFDVSTDYDSKSELDFNNRLVAKFIIPNSKTFWGTGLNKIPESMLFPSNDRIANLCKNIKTSIEREIYPGEIGEFISEWIKFENLLIRKAQNIIAKPMSVREANQILTKAGRIKMDQSVQIDDLRKFRNSLVHENKKVDPISIPYYLGCLRNLLTMLNSNDQ